MSWKENDIKAAGLLFFAAIAIAINGCVDPVPGRKPDTRHNGRATTVPGDGDTVEIRDTALRRELERLINAPE